MEKKLPRINFEATKGQKKKIKEKCVRDNTSIKEVGIRLFDKWLQGKIKI